MPLLTFGLGKLPVFFKRQVAEKAFDRVNTDRTVGESPVTDILAGVIADPAVNRRHRVVVDEFSPGRFVITRLRQRQPGLDIFAGRAGIIAGWQEIDIVRPLRAQRPCTSAVARQVCALCQIFGSHNWLQ